jgi:hypothetical protein
VTVLMLQLMPNRRFTLMLYQALLDPSVKL